MAGICSYVGFYHLWIHIRRKNEWVSFSFAMMCFTIAFYDIFCVGLYNAESFVHGLFWQRLQLVNLALLSIAIAWFVYYFTGTKSKKLFIFFTVYFAFFCLLRMVV